VPGLPSVALFVSAASKRTSNALKRERNAPLPLRRTDRTCVMAALLLPVQEGEIWRVQIVWANGAVHFFGKFTSERDAIDWINAHPRLTNPEDTMDEPQDADRSC
jgi:hypothetical protein